MIYIQEAHATDGWQTESNVKDKILIANPKSLEERGSVAHSCLRNLKIDLPALLDDFENSVEAAYTGWPDRLYVIDRQGRVAHKGKAGPFGFKPQEVRETLRRLVPSSNPKPIAFLAEPAP
jgi:iodothyronine deiodinase-like protein